MDTRQLRYFAAIYEHGTLSAAAASERVAISALSHHLANLERELGTRLFVRKPRGLEPTAAGQRLNEHARSILKSVSDAETDVREAGGSIGGDVSIGMAFSAVKMIGVDFVSRVLNDFPLVGLSLTESLSGSSLMRVLATDIDLALVYNPPADPRLKTRPVLRERLVCVGTPELMGPHGEPITFDEVRALPLILLRQGASALAILDDLPLLKKLESSARVRMNSLHAMAGSLIAGLGCAVGTDLFMREHVESGALSLRPIVEPDLRRTLYLCELAGKPPRFALEAMSDLILELVADSVRRGDWHAELVQDG